MNDTNQSYLVEVQVCREAQQILRFQLDILSSPSNVGNCLRPEQTILAQSGV